MTYSLTYGRQQVEQKKAGDFIKDLASRYKATVTTTDSSVVVADMLDLKVVGWVKWHVRGGTALMPIHEPDEFRKDPQPHAFYTPLEQAL